MSATDTLTATLASHPKLLAAVSTALLLLSQAGTVVADCGNSCGGP